MRSRHRPRICGPDQIRLKRWDELYGYEMSAQFFGENGTLTRTADRIKIGVRNARTAGDWKIIQDTLQRFYTLMDFPPESVTALSAHAHTKFPTTEERDAILQKFSYSPLFSKPAALGYVQVIDWEREIRVLIEASNVVRRRALRDVGHAVHERSGVGDVPPDAADADG